MAHLNVLAEPLVLAVAGIACILEFVADKVLWFDSVWDSFHTVIRPIGAAALAWTAIGSVDPATKFAVVLLCGGVAFASHSSKAAARLMVNHSPEPFSNIALSFAEDLFAPVCAWLAISHPVVTFALVLLFLGVFAWVSAGVFRLIRLQLIALRTFFTRSTASRSGAQKDVLGLLADNAVPLPAKYAGIVGGSSPRGVRSAATKKVPGLRNSVGYLCMFPDEIVFVTRRGFRYRQHRIPIAVIQNASLERGILMHRLILRTVEREFVFYLFKDFPARSTRNAS